MRWSLSQPSSALFQSSARAIRRSAELHAQAAVAVEFRTHLRNREILANEELLRERRNPLELIPPQTPLATSHGGYISNEIANWDEVELKLREAYRELNY